MQRIANRATLIGIQAPLLILSTPTGERPGANAFHKQAWSAAEAILNGNAAGLYGLSN